MCLTSFAVAVSESFCSDAQSEIFNQFSDYLAFKIFLCAFKKENGFNFIRSDGCKVIYMPVNIFIILLMPVDALLKIFLRAS